jgi:branched-chain amino acid transport system substrate-binding protein
MPDGEAAALAAAVIFATRSGGSGTSASRSAAVVGTSLSLTGDSPAGGAFQRGGKLCAPERDKAGGRPGPPIQLKIVNGNSGPGTLTTNYTQLISQDHVSFPFGPFSSLLTAPAAQRAARYDHAFSEGAGGAPPVFDLKLPRLPTVGAPAASFVQVLPAGLAGPAAIVNPEPARGKG